MKMLARAGFTCLAVVLFAPGMANADKIKGDAAAGRLKASTCIGCHGIATTDTMYPTYDVPKLGGQHAQYIVSALRDYRSGKRKFSTMDAQASALSDQDMADIAAFFSQQESASH